MVRHEISRLRSFGQYVEIHASRSPELLSAIDNVLFACDQIRGQLDVFTGIAHEFIQGLKRCESAIDPDGSALAELEKARDAVGEAYKFFKGMRASAKSDPRLKDDDCVVDGFDGVLDAFAAAHNALNDLCWALGEHDADFEKPSGKSYSDIDEMFSSMGL